MPTKKMTEKETLEKIESDSYVFIAQKVAGENEEPVLSLRKATIESLVNVLKTFDNNEEDAHFNALKFQIEMMQYYGDANVKPSNTDLFEFHSLGVMEAEEGENVTEWGVRFAWENIEESDIIKTYDIVIPFEYDGIPVTHILANAFNVDTETRPDICIRSIVVPESVVSIGENAFTGCKNIKEIYFPKNLKNIDAEILEKVDNIYFAGTTQQWKQVTVGENNDALLNATIHFGYYEKNPENEKLKRFKNYGDYSIEPTDASYFEFTQDGDSIEVSLKAEFKEDAIHVVIPYECEIDGVIYPVEKISSSGGLSGCSNLETVIIPSSVKWIEIGSFMNCVKLKDVFVKGSETNAVSSFGFTPFRGCENIRIICRHGSAISLFAKENNIECVFETVETDDVPTENSTKLITSGGMYTALQNFFSYIEGYENEIDSYTGALGLGTWYRINPPQDDVVISWDYYYIFARESNNGDLLQVKICENEQGIYFRTGTKKGADIPSFGGGDSTAAHEWNEWNRTLLSNEIDDTPTKNSKNLITSGGVYDALQKIPSGGGNAGNFMISASFSGEFQQGAPIEISIDKSYDDILAAYENHYNLYVKLDINMGMEFILQLIVFDGMDFWFKWQNVVGDMLAFDLDVTLKKNEVLLTWVPVKTELVEEDNNRLITSGGVYTALQKLKSEKNTQPLLLVEGYIEKNLSNGKYSIVNMASHEAILEAYNSGKQVVIEAQIAHINDEYTSINQGNVFLQCVNGYIFQGVSSLYECIEVEFMPNTGTWNCSAAELVTKDYIDTRIGDIESSIERIIEKYNIGETSKDEGDANIE